mmetsp:Transcript_31785/g.81730  ORF Transcript_31785/g.81730 Transcript_31785/m.81730 type:complete len:285 (-) Transcript_31785:80-934(-)
MSRLGASALLVCAAFCSSLREAVALVDCGGNFANDCGECPNGNGETWCNGECTWFKQPTGGMCLAKVPIPGFVKENSPIGANFYYWATAFTGSIPVMLIFSCVYYARVIVGPPEMPKVGFFDATPARRGLFDCLSKPDVCLYTTFCMPVVAGKNYHIAGVCGFWPGCCFTTALLYGPWACWGFWPGIAGGLTILTCVRAFLAGMVQKKLGFQEHFCKNFIYSAFCMPCDVGRESLEADKEVGADVTCCCTVTYESKVSNEIQNLVEGTVDKAERSCTKNRMCGH